MYSFCYGVKTGNYAESLRSEREFPHYYEIIEENHHFHKEKEKFFRISQIYRNVIVQSHR